MTKSDETREKILFHAKKIFAEKGYYQAQISDIIESAKIGRGTVYQYFSNKEHLFISLLERFLIDWEIYSGQLVINNEDLSKISHFRYLEQRMYQAFKFFFSDRDRAKIILRVGLGLPEHFEQKIAHFENKLIGMIIDDLKIAVLFSHISEDSDLEFMANLVAGSVFRLAHYFLSLEVDTNVLLLQLDEISKKAAKIIGNGIFNKK